MANNIEIERKFLVNGTLLTAAIFSQTATVRTEHTIEQGYLTPPGGNNTVRVRTVDDSIGVITVKGKTVGATRSEYEYTIPYEDALSMLLMCDRRIQKTRSIIIDEYGQEWHVDFFWSGTHADKVVAEIEIDSEDQQIKIPAWVGEDVTSNPDYYNSNMATNSD